MPPFSLPFSVENQATTLAVAVAVDTLPEKQRSVQSVCIIHGGGGGGGGGRNRLGLLPAYCA